jgi:ribosome-binding factor A
VRPTRKKRLDDLFREILADLLLTKVSDPRLALATVTSVRISPELDTAKVFVSVLGDEEKRSEVMAALRRAAPFLRTELAREVRVRRTPELRFLFDESMEHGLRMERMLREIAEERAERSPDADAAAAADPDAPEGAEDDAR